MGERRQREERHVHFVPRRQGDFRRICLQPRIRRAENPQLQLPEPGSDAQFQRQELRFEKRSAGPRERQHDRGPALPAHPPHGGGHRGGDHPRHGLRRELRLVRQRPAHHAGRHAPDGPARRRRQDGQGILPQGLRPLGHPHVDHRGHFDQGHRPDLREPDEDQVRFEGGRTGGLGQQLRGRLPHQAPRRLPAQARRDGADSPAEDRREREGAQGDLGHPEEGPRDGQEGEPEQQETARLQDPPHGSQRAGRTVDDLHHGGQLGVRLHHQEPRRAYAGGLLAARQAAELLRTDEEGGLRERGVQPPSGGAEHRGGHG